MRAGDIGLRNASLDGVDIHEKRHDVLIPCHDPHGAPVFCRQHIAQLFDVAFDNDEIPKRGLPHG